MHSNIVSSPLNMLSNSTLLWQYVMLYKLVSEHNYGVSLHFQMKHLLLWVFSDINLDILKNTAAHLWVSTSTNSLVSTGTCDSLMCLFLIFLCWTILNQMLDCHLSSNTDAVTGHAHLQLLVHVLSQSVVTCTESKDLDHLLTTKLMTGIIPPTVWVSSFHLRESHKECSVPKGNTWMSVLSLREYLNECIVPLEKSEWIPLSA